MFNVKRKTLITDKYRKYIKVTVMLKIVQMYRMLRSFNWNRFINVCSCKPCTLDTVVRLYSKRSHFFQIKGTIMLTSVQGVVNVIFYKLLSLNYIFYYNLLSNLENVILDAISIKYQHLHHKKGTKMLKGVQNAYLR